MVEHSQQQADPDASISLLWSVRFDPGNGGTAPLGQLLVGGVPAPNPAEEAATNWKLSVPVSVLIRSCYFTYDSAWIADSHAVGRNIMNHDTASADDYIITD